VCFEREEFYRGVEDFCLLGFGWGVGAEGGGEEKKFFSVSSYRVLSALNGLRRRWKFF
jgi:hypothetical protein